MAKANSSSEANGNVSIAKITAVQAIIVALISSLGAFATGYLAAFQKVENNLSVQPVVTNNLISQSVDLVSIEDLKKALGEAKFRIWATGYFLEPINTGLINNKITDSPTFAARIVLVNPFSSVLCQRENDEGNDRNYAKILTKIRGFHKDCNQFMGNKVELRLSNVYQTFTVFIVDADLYTYFYPYKGYGTNSPVLKFKDYSMNPRANFFSTHLDKIFNEAKPVIRDSDFQPYESVSLDNPCNSKNAQ
jgi:hypothetical protein